MKTLADITLEEFTRIAHEEGIINDIGIAYIYNDRPMPAPWLESTIRKIFREFKVRINNYEA